jgi:hypothetical protein
MRRALIATYLAFALLSGPADTLAAGDRVLIDATFMAEPPWLEGPCMRLDPGQVTARVRNLGLPPPGGHAADVRPAGFRLTSYRGADRDGRIDLPVTREEDSDTTRVAGGVYCWVLDVDAPVQTSAPIVARENYTQFVALKLTWTPQ